MSDWMSDYYRKRILVWNDVILILNESLCENCSIAMTGEQCPLDCEVLAVRRIARENIEKIKKEQDEAKT